MIHCDRHPFQLLSFRLTANRHLGQLALLLLPVLKLSDYIIKAFPVLIKLLSLKRFLCLSAFERFRATWLSSFAALVLKSRLEVVN